MRAEKFSGGSLAVANHVASCCSSVQLVTMIGSQDSHEDLMRSALKPTVAPHFLVMNGAPTLIKRRFIETYPFQKLFEVYVMDEAAAERESANLCAALERILPDVDLAIVADYGHGMISSAVVELLCAKAKC